MKVYKKNGKWCFEICRDEYCEGDKVKWRNCLGEEKEGILRFGMALIPDNEYYGDNVIIGFYLEVEDDDFVHVDKILKKYRGKECFTKDLVDGWHMKYKRRPKYWYSGD